MPPKKSAKAKKEEVVEIPNTSLLADGKQSIFIGQWSQFQTIACINDATKLQEAGDVVNILPGVYDGDHTVEVRSLEVVGVCADSISAIDFDPPAPKATDEEGGAADDGGAVGEDPDANEGAQQQQNAAAVPPPVDRSVVIRGNITFEAWTPPRPPTPKKPPTPVETAKPSKAKKGEKGKAAAVAPPPEEEEAKPAEAPVEEQKGAKPANWPTLKLRNLCFSGTLTAKGVHLDLENCHFQSGEGNQLQAHQYTKVSCVNCTFSTPSKSAVYCYPLSNVTLTKCFFNGVDQFALQQERLGIHVPELDAMRQQAASSNNVGVMADNATLKLSGSYFAHLTTGLLLHDHCDGTSVTRCNFDNIYGTGVFLDKCAGTMQQNAIRKCGHYGMRMMPGCKSKVMQNTVISQVVVEKGATPFLHTNELGVHLIDRNDAGGAVYMEAKY